MVEIAPIGTGFIECLQGKFSKVVGLISRPNTLERSPSCDTLLKSSPQKSLSVFLNNLFEKLMKFCDKLEDKNILNASVLPDLRETAENLVARFKESEGQECYANILDKLKKYVKYSPEELPEGEFREFRYGEHNCSKKSADNIRKNGFNPYFCSIAEWDLGRGFYFWPENEISQSDRKIYAQISGKLGYISRRDYGEISSEIGKSVRKYSKKYRLSSEESRILYNELYPHILHENLGFDGLYTCCYSRLWSWHSPSKNRAFGAGKTPQLVVYNADSIKIVE